MSSVAGTAIPDILPLPPAGRFPLPTRTDIHADADRHARRKLTQMSFRRRPS